MTGHDDLVNLKNGIWGHNEDSFPWRFVIVRNDFRTPHLDLCVCVWGGGGVGRRDVVGVRG